MRCCNPGGSARERDWFRFGLWGALAEFDTLNRAGNFKEPVAAALKAVGNRIASTTTWDIINAIDDNPEAIRQKAAMLLALVKFGSVSREAIRNASKSWFLVAVLPMLNDLLGQLSSYISLPVEGVRLQLV